jgi:hypothetical protein
VARAHRPAARRRGWFLAELEERLGRRLRPEKRGRKRAGEGGCIVTAQEGQRGAALEAQQAGQLILDGWPRQ